MVTKTQDSGKSGMTSLMARETARSIEVQEGMLTFLIILREEKY
jgi:hypothetical protein